MPIPLHCVQLNSVWEDKASNFNRARTLLQSTAPAPGSLIIFSEMFATGFSCRLEATLEPLHGETEAFLREIACTWQSTVIGGLITPGKDGQGRNQALVIGPEGQELARYTKQRPFSLGGESSVHAAGNHAVVFAWAGLQISPLICYDLRFPELARESLQLGAEVLVYIAAWPVKRQQHWLTLLQARAIENQAYVIGVNRCGQEPQYSYAGRSVVVDPHGVIIADAGEQERVLTAHLDADLVRQWRADFPAARDFTNGGL